MHLFRVSLRYLQPSQSCINADKLARLMQQLAHQPIETQEAVPIWRWGDRLILTDGHTRAFAAWLMGHDKIMARWETDALDWEAYQICVRWCEESGIRSVPDLRGRVVSLADFQSRWLDKCLKMQGDLYEKRVKAPMDMESTPVETTMNTRINRDVTPVTIELELQASMPGDARNGV